MEKPYRFGVPRTLVYIFHIIVGMWIVYVGYLLTRNRPLGNVHRALLLIAGIVSLTYHLVLWLWFPSKMYACKTPSWAVHAAHFLVGAMLLLMAWIPELFPAWGGIPRSCLVGRARCTCCTCGSLHRKS